MELQMQIQPAVEATSKPNLLSICQDFVDVWTPSSHVINWIPSHERVVFRRYWTVPVTWYPHLFTTDHYWWFPVSSTPLLCIAQTDGKQRLTSSRRWMQWTIPMYPPKCDFQMSLLWMATTMGWWSAESSNWTRASLEGWNLMACAYDYMYR